MKANNPPQTLHAWRCFGTRAWSCWVKPYRPSSPCATRASPGTPITSPTRRAARLPVQRRPSQTAMCRSPSGHKLRDPSSALHRSAALSATSRAGGRCAARWPENAGRKPGRHWRYGQHGCGRGCLCASHGWPPDNGRLSPAAAPHHGSASPAPRPGPALSMPALLRLEAAAAACTAAGATVTDVELPPPFAEALDAHDVVMTYEAWRMLAHERTSLLGPAVAGPPSRDGAGSGLLALKPMPTPSKFRSRCRHAPENRLRGRGCAADPVRHWRSPCRDWASQVPPNSTASGPLPARPASPCRG